MSFAGARRRRGACCCLAQRGAGGVPAPTRCLRNNRRHPTHDNTRLNHARIAGQRRHSGRPGARDWRRLRDASRRKAARARDTHARAVHLDAAVPWGAPSRFRQCREHAARLPFAAPDPRCPSRPSRGVRGMSGGLLAPPVPRAQEPVCTGVDVEPASKLRGRSAAAATGAACHLCPPPLRLDAALPVTRHRVGSPTPCASAVRSSLPSHDLTSPYRFLLKRSRFTSYTAFFFSLSFRGPWNSSLSPTTRYHGPKMRAHDRGDAVSWAVRTLAQAFGGEGLHRDWRDAGWQHSHNGDWLGGENQDGSPAPCQEDPSRVRASRAIGSGAPSGKNGEATGSRLLCSAPAIGDSARRRGEVLQSRRSRCPAGTGKSCGRRGGLVGLSPEALCGEDPNGQPVFRGEHLVAVCVEAPKCHPMIHGCRRQHKPRPRGKPKERRGKVANRRHGRQKRPGKNARPFSRTAALEAGCFWETKGDAKSFLEKSGDKKEVSVEKLDGKDGQDFGSRTRSPNRQNSNPKRQEDWSATEDAADESATEEVIQVMSGVDPGEVKQARKCGWRRRSRPWRRGTGK